MADEQPTAPESLEAPEEAEKSASQGDGVGESGGGREPIAQEDGDTAQVTDPEAAAIEAPDEAPTEVAEEGAEKAVGAEVVDGEEGQASPIEVKDEEQTEDPGTLPEPDQDNEDDAQKADEADVVEGEEKTPTQVGENDGLEDELADGAAEGAEEGQEEESNIPQSEALTEDEPPEEVVTVGEKLSREGSPASGIMTDEVQVRMESPPIPGTPDPDGSRGVLLEGQEGEGEEEEEYEIEESPQFDREQLIERYQQALAEREQLQHQNHQLQHKLAEYFRKKKSDDARQEVDKNVTDQEQRYLKYLANLDELRRQDAEERDTYKMQIEELKERCGEKQERVEEERLKFMDFKKYVALNSINSRSGKAIPVRDIEQYLAFESKKEGDVVNVRLENIKLKNKLKKKELQLKSKEELAEGLHLIDFEQLKIENQTYNEKIEERNEELLKLRKKITSTVQVLTHLKEKLQFVQAENGVLKTNLRDVEETAAKKRDILSRTKQARDALRIDNHKLRQNCGLLGNEALLRDFEERKDESEDLREKLERLKMLHADLTLTCNGVRRKIEQARSNRR